jgi:GNAT superfamily N-acetyltransferase
MPFAPRQAKIPVTIRPLEDEDIPKIFQFENSSVSKQYRRDLLTRLEHLFADIPTCYVAVTTDNTPVYIQWLMPHTENEKIQAHFNGIFPILAPDEVLLENALTQEKFRNQGIRSYSMAIIAAYGKKLGARWAMTFIADHNTPSLKGAKNAGFVPYMIRHERWFLFFRSLTFTKLPPCTPYPFETAIPEVSLKQN